MGKDKKKSRNRSPSPSSRSSSSSRSRTPSRSRSRERSSRRLDRDRSRSRDRSSRKRHRRSRTRSRSRSRSRSRTRSSRDRKKVKHEERSVKRERRSRTPPPKREHGASAAMAAAAAPAAASLSPTVDLRRLKAEEKARLKASETPEERQARRQAKKALKAAANGSAGALPGGGASLLETAGAKPFVWKKKYEKSIEEGLDPQILTREQLAAKQRALQEEIAAIKARKIARAEEKEAMDALREQMARDAESEAIEGWEEKEEEFHRANAKLRTELRIAEGREKVIDVLAKQRSLWHKLRQGPTDEERELHPEWEGAALDPNLSAEKDIELTEPHLLFTSGALPWRDLEFLQKDIAAYIQLGEKEDERYWAACNSLCAAAILKQKSAAFAPGAVQQYGRFQHQHSHQQPALLPPVGAEGADGTIKGDIALLLRGKNLAELEHLERDIALLLSNSPDASATLRALSEGLDHSYWEQVMKELQQFKHIAFLREFHVELLEARLKDLQKYIVGEELREKARREALRAERVAAAGGGAEGEQRVAEAEAAGEHAGGIGAAGEEEEDDLAFEPALIPHEQFEAMGGVAEGEVEGRDDDGSFSPVPMPDDEAEEEGKPAAAAAAATAGSSRVRVLDAAADARELAEARRQVAEQKQRELEERAKMAAGSAIAASTSLVPSLVPSAAAAASASSSQADAAYRREAARGVEGDEVQLKSDFAIPAQVHWWGDKYRARKPRFFNRVKTGFEWNKYNGTHYDKENPPPKIVQGYKFNIFYPDLIDPSVPPRYRIEPDPGGNPDFCILRFMAGPPYEDLAFKIVNKEWEYSFKRGYKCVFDRGVLALYFNFRRYFYRR